MPYKINNTQFWPQVIPDASTTEEGVMTPAQVAKLESLSPLVIEAQGVPVPVEPALNFVGDYWVISDVPGVSTNVEIAEATESTDGLMSAADKQTLDNLAAGGVSLYDFFHEGTAAHNGGGLLPVLTFTPPGGFSPGFQQIQLEWLTQANNGGFQAQRGGAIFSFQGGVPGSIVFIQQSEIYQQGDGPAITTQFSTNGTTITASVVFGAEGMKQVRVRIIGTVWRPT